jgi:TonB-linked SusC/RagA family outer membrane protein
MVCLLLLSARLPGAVQQEKITLNLKDVSITQFFREVEQMTPYRFFYKDSQVENAPKVNVQAVDKTLASILETVFGKMNLDYKITGNQIVVTQKEMNQRNVIAISGIVVDKGKVPLAGVAVIITGTRKGVNTDENGKFTIDIPVQNYKTLEFRMIGMNDLDVTLDKRTFYEVVLEESTLQLSDVVVTGIVDRRAESFTGSVSTISSKELVRAGNKNVLESLKNIDPSIYFMDNFTQGSNPNALPQMEIRGTSSFPAEESSTGITLKGNYGNIPNMPLFILDGFETTVERVMDMDMNRVESVTILKDASAKALYGSKAANGVIVIETKKLSGNQQRVTYTGSLDISMPDLTSYNLANAAEKLEIERIEGIYTDDDIDYQLKLTQLYNERKKLIEEGLDTYWLSKPLRVGVGYKHNLNIELGDSKSLKGIADFTYNKINGVMKDSYRRNISGSINLSYRYKNVLFRNIMTAVSNFSQESPWGTFGDYAKMNPYWRSNDPETGLLLRWAELSTQTPNPMYDATIGTLNTSSYLDFTNNFYVEIRPVDHLKVTGRLGVSAKRSEADEFLPANHSKFSTGTYDHDDMIMRKGSYRLDNGKSSSFSGDLNASYTRNFDRHFVFVNLGAFASESMYSAYVNIAEGFPNNQVADITFARQYAEGTRPVGLSSLNREISFLATANYAYNNKYLVDATYRISASSLYGKDNRWAPGWSVGIGWNLHHENFLKDSKVIEQLKIRGSVGVTGNQNFNTSYAVGTYNYYTDYNYNGFTGAYLSNLPNPYLKWEQKKEYNIGVDASIGRLQLTADYYDSYTENMVTDVSVSPSTGFSMVKDNLGLVRNLGFEIKANLNLWQADRGFVNIYGSVSSNTNKIVSLSESMKTYNELQEKEAADKGNSTPVLKYVDGMSMTSIWAVRSLGIDPMNGLEVYLKRDGTRTFQYDPLDLVVVGDSKPKARGHFGVTAEYKGFGLSTTFRYLVGGQMYNQTLVDRVEDVDIDFNVDKRVLLGRWQYPGHHAAFKRLGTFTYEGDATSYQAKTQATSRFVQDRNELTWGSATMYYEFPKVLLDKWNIERMRFSVYMNDILVISSIQTERGLDYPFARTVSCSLSITF